MPAIQLTGDRSTGLLRDADGRAIIDGYVLSTTTAELVGTRVASDPSKELVLYKIAAPARVTTEITGLYQEPSSPWSSGHVVWRHLECRGGAFTVVLRSDNRLFNVAQT